MKQPMKLTESDFPTPGSVVVAPTEDGRWVASLILRRQAEGGAWGVLIMATLWLDTAIPALDEPLLHQPLILTHHNWKGKPEIFWTHQAMPAEFRSIGTVTLTADELNHTSYSFGGWHSVPLQALKQWRWDHQREQLLHEEAEQAAAEAERRQRAATVRAEFMRSLTLDALKNKDWLATWGTQVPIDSKSAAQHLLTQLVQALLDQPRLTQARARKLFQQTVEAFNRLDAASPFIFTQEREDLYEAFEQIACAAGFPLLTDQIDRWRNW